LIQKARALGPWQDQVEVCEEADPGVKGHPAEDEVEGVFYGGEGGEDDEVDEPGCEEGWVRRVERFVGCEDGEEDCGCDAGILLARSLDINTVQNLSLILEACDLGRSNRHSSRYIIGLPYVHARACRVVGAGYYLRQAVGDEAEHHRSPSVYFWYIGV
jgi:hypothetical protein